MDFIFVAFDFIISALFVWVLPLVALGFLGFSFYYNDSKSFGSSTTCMLISVTLAAWYFWSDISTMIVEHGKVASVFFLVAFYIAAAVATSFVYWVFFNWKAKERFDNLLEITDIKSWASDESDSYKLSLRKYLVISDSSNRRSIFDDHGHLLNLDITELCVTKREKSDFIQPLQAELDNAVAKILPPRFATCKKYIIGAGSSWPITLIWLLISRVCRRVCYVVVVSCRPHNIHIRDCSIPDSAKASPSSSTVTVATVLSNSFH